MLSRFSDLFPMPTTLSSDFIKAEALRLGFFACGLSAAAPIDKQRAQRRERWVAEGCHAEMSYLERNEDKRRDPRLLVEGAQTVVSVALNYYTFVPDTEHGGERHIPIARYARGRDYHDVMKQRLHALLHILAEKYGEPSLAGSRAFVDTAPIDERHWAWRSGLGWIGKNTQLIIPGAGSYFFLGELLLTLPADNYDSPIKNRCGTCRRCLTSCPTQALSEENGLDARRCLSYLTIEYRGENLPEGTGRKMGNTFYGCDRCSDCCPWNKWAHPTAETDFQPSQALLNMTFEDWKKLTIEEYRKLFKGSAVKRAKFEGLTRNIRTLAEAETEE